MWQKNGKMDLPEKWIWQKNGFTRKMDLPEKWIYQKNGFGSHNLMNYSIDNL